jgi:predicted lipoprotein with Yx(FWY)xxD motif
MYNQRMKRSHIALILGSALALAACGGGGGGSSPATPVATPTPVTPQSGTIPQRATVQSNAGGSASSWVGTTFSGGTGPDKPLYTYTGDTTSTATCTGGCLSAWPAYTSTAGDTPQGNMTPCPGSTQWCYEGHPLYSFVGDSAQAASGTVQATGDGDAVPANGSSGASGTFVLAKPNANATPPPNSTPPPGGGYY